MKYWVAFLSSVGVMMTTIPAHRAADYAADEQRRELGMHDERGKVCIGPDEGRGRLE